MPYAGDVSCHDCWSSLERDSASQLVDVRTLAEWNFVGIPDLGSIGKELIKVEWQSFPSMGLNPGFVNEVAHQLEAAGASHKADIFILCRSGVRSMAAANAITKAGYEMAFNVTGGFEGDPDENRQRGNRNGWKHDELPWRQN